VVYVAHDPPRRWLIAHLVEKAFRAECLPVALAKRGLAPASARRSRNALARDAVASAPADRVTLEPTAWVVLQNGIPLPATIAKYSPPVAGEAMSGPRPRAAGAWKRSDMPILPLGDSTALKIGDKLSIIGFPNVVASHELLDKSAKPQASVRTAPSRG